MIKIGITGGIATGKSQVSKIFKEQNIPVIDADLVAREVVEPGSVALEKLKFKFGNKIIENGQLNRKMLSELVFADPAKLKSLNEIMQDEIYHAIKAKLSFFESMKTAVVALDIPLLYEQNYDKLCDEVVVVNVSAKLQLERLIERNQLTEQEANQRIKSQLALAQKVQLADYVIDNNGTLKDTYQQTLEIINQIFEKYNVK